MTRAFVAFGANIGKPSFAYQHANQMLRTLVAFDRPKAGKRTSRPIYFRASRLVQTDPVGESDEPKTYSNGCFVFDTTMTARQILEITQVIECQLGRQRQKPWDDRPIDLDLLLFGDNMIAEPDLLVPHPRLHFRRFALAPLVELNPTVIHPLLQESAEQMLERLDDADCLIVISDRDAVRGHVQGLGDGRPFRRILNWRVETLSLNYLSIGPQLVGVQLPDVVGETWPPDRTWVVAAFSPAVPIADPVPSELSRWPVVDCRGETDADILREIDRFVASLAK